MTSPYTFFTSEADVDISKFDVDVDQMDYYILNIFSRVIRQEERMTGRMSGLRIFCRVDASIYRHAGAKEHHFFVNEITRTHGAGLFPSWDTNNRLDFLFVRMAKVLHYVAQEKIFQKPPTPF